MRVDMDLLLKILSQWALTLQIDVKSGSILWYHTNRRDFDIKLIPNCKYHMEININHQCDVKNVSRKLPLVKQIMKTNFAWKLILAETFFYVSVQLTPIWCRQLMSRLALIKMLDYRLFPVMLLYRLHTMQK